MDAEWFGLKLVVRSLFAITVIAMMISMVHAQPPTLLWSDPVNTQDIDLSKDGRYVANVIYIPKQSGQVQFYGRSSGTPIWTWTTEEDLYSVAISADGDSVAAGGGTHVFFWENARSRSTATADPTWTSTALGVIDRRCLDISDDGEYVVAGGTGPNLFYWANAKAKAGTDVATTWKAELAGTVEAVDLSDDGGYVVAGFADNVAYFKNARTRTGAGQTADWISTEPDEYIVDVAVSDDGNYVAAAALLDTVYYWAGAKGLGDDPATTWYGGLRVSFTSLDMSCDGDSVIAGAFYSDEGPEVYFWSGARTLTGKPQPPSWTYDTDTPVADVAINDAGTYMAAATSGYLTVYFFDNSGALKWSEPVEEPVVMSISISCDGGTLAVGTREIPATSYLFDTGFSTPCCGAAPPVGGVVSTPSGALGTITPYLALAVIAGAAAVIVVFAKKRKA
jgi:hypothetical protein